VLPETREAIQVSQAGDLWLLGRHKVYCGNSLNGSSYSVLMGGHRADMVFTDPRFELPACIHILQDAPRASRTGRLGLLLANLAHNFKLDWHTVDCRRDIFLVDQRIWQIHFHSVAVIDPCDSNADIAREELLGLVFCRPSFFESVSHSSIIRST
jgi:hypothetical protein